MGRTNGVGCRIGAGGHIADRVNRLPIGDVLARVRPCPGGNPEKGVQLIDWHGVVAFGRTISLCPRTFGRTVDKGLFGSELTAIPLCPKGGGWWGRTFSPDWDSARKGHMNGPCGAVAAASANGVETAVD